MHPLCTSYKLLHIIAPFSTWIEKYGDRIGNFGGVDLDIICINDEKEIKEYVENVIAYSIDSGGFALGSGNSIPDYVPVKGYLAMINTAREIAKKLLGN